MYPSYQAIIRELSKNYGKLWEMIFSVLQSPLFYNRERWSDSMERIKFSTLHLENLKRYSKQGTNATLYIDSDGVRL